MCDVPSIAVFCSESIECFPGTVSNFFLKLLVTIPVAPIITGKIVHFIIIIIIIIIITINCNWVVTRWQKAYRTKTVTIQNIHVVYETVNVMLSC